MVLFLPDEKGTYWAWTSNADFFGKTRFNRDERVVALIDPPEEGAYSSMGECRVLKFVSNNWKKHFSNWDKDGELLVTSMPSKEEVLVMTEVLWNDKRTPLDKTRVENKQGLVEHRMRFVGPVPRNVFDRRQYRKALNKGLHGAHKISKELDEEELFSALMGTYVPPLEKHSPAAASGVFLLNASRAPCDTAEDREPELVQLQLTPVATWKLREKLQTAVEKLSPSRFEEFAFYRVSLDLDCKRDGQREVAYSATWQTALEKIKALTESDNVLYRPNVSNFPLVDFVRSNSKWYNAKSGDKPIVSLGEAFTFLKEMGVVKKRGDSPGWIPTEKGKSFRSELTLVTRTDEVPDLRPDPIIKKHGEANDQKKLFRRLVNVEAYNIGKKDILDPKLMMAVEQELVDVRLTPKPNKTS